MGSCATQSSLQGSTGLFGNILNKTKLLVFGHGIDMREHAMLIKWIGADATVLFEEPLSGNRYEEIVIMRMKIPERFEDYAKQIINEHLPTRLTPNGRITNLNDLSEEQNEPQGLSGQADAGKPDAG